MKPSIGRIVVLHGWLSNGAMDHAAVITRVWAEQDTASGPVLVNLTVFPDMAAPIAQGSVHLFDTPEQAHAHRAGTGGLVAHWPARS